ncbi:hypothetical protein MXB_1718, partial [Myxobolus squamalis]
IFIFVVRVIRDISTEFTDLIKNAHDTLKDPYLRACYLYTLIDGGKSIFDYNDTEEFDNFLRDIFDLNERISNISTSIERDEILEYIDQRIKEINVDLPIHFHSCISFQLYVLADLPKLRLLIKNLKFWNN